MEKLHRASDNAAVTLSGQRGVILRSSAKIPHKIIGEDGKSRTIAVDSFSYHPSVSSEKVTLVWNNPKGLVVIDRGIADFLLLRKWAKEVTDEALEWWNSQIDQVEAASAEPKEPPSTPAPTEPPKPVEPPAPAPVTPPKEPEAPKTPAPAAPKPAAPKPAAPAATKEEALKRAEEEAARLAGDGEKKPVTD